MESTRILFPIGHMLGSICDPENPEFIRYGVRVGAVEFDLSLPEFVVWSSAHGVPEVVREQPWTLAETRRAAGEAGVGDGAEVAEHLLSMGLLREVELGTDDVKRFAAEHRVFPLLLGLGNTQEDPAGFRIGTSEDVASVVSLPVYVLWSRAHLEPSLLAACTPLASAELEPAGVAERFLRVAHNVLAVSGMYFDPVGAA